MFETAIGKNDVQEICSIHHKIDACDPAAVLY